MRNQNGELVAAQNLMLDAIFGSEAGEVQSLGVKSLVRMRWLLEI